MKRLHHALFGILLMIALTGCSAVFAASRPSPGAEPRFKQDLLKPVAVTDSTGTTATFYDPKDPYAIFINYELGMHCVGFDISYCCVIPPYNSVQAQAVKTGAGGALPRMLSPRDGVSLSYSVRDNTYSEGNKMKYWAVPKDVNANGRMDDPGDSLPNYVWTHLFIYKDLEGTLPVNWTEASRLRVGREIQVPIDAGPTGKSISGGALTYAGASGGNKVFTDSLIPEVKNVQLTLTASYLWDALGLPLTAFNDSRRKGTLRTISDRDFQPYQYSVVRLLDKDGSSVIAHGRPVEFFGTNPIDFPSCHLCHSVDGKAAKLSREEGLSRFDQEYAYWKKNYPDISEFMARQSAAAINILELHDRHHGTTLLAQYDPDATTNRLGAVGPAYCADCHGDNISGTLQSPRPGASGYKTVKAMALTEALHMTHAASIPMPDKGGRTQNCQVCHPSHWQQEAMNIGNNPFRIIDEGGNPRFSNADVRAAGGGCYLRRDAHANPAVKPPFFLNGIGTWYLKEVSRKDENGRTVPELRGLYCTNCHSLLSQELYRYDDLTNAALQEGRTLRNRPVKDIMAEIANKDAIRFKNYFADPIVGAGGDPLRSYYEKHEGAALVKASKDEAGKLKLLAWNEKDGSPVAYEKASAGKDWWLSAAEPHCADCHLAPFVESAGGGYFPVDQPNKYALYRYSKAHGVIACQSCHESVHGLYPVRYEGPEITVDLTTHEQALQFSPDGKYAGPVTCSACHRVNDKGVPVQLSGTEYEQDYWASVVLLHAMREGDQDLPVRKLVEKYPYQKARKIVEDGWE